MDMPSIEAEPLSQNAYAISRGISKQRVNQYVHDDGMPLNDDGSVDPVAADKWIRENVQGRNVGSGVQKERSDQRARLIAAQARKIEAEYDVKFGHMIQASVVREYNTQNALAARAFILSTPSRIRHLLKLSCQQEKLMEQFIDDGLTQLARQSPAFIGVVPPTVVEDTLKDETLVPEELEEIVIVGDDVVLKNMQNDVSKEEPIDPYDGPRLPNGEPMFSQADLDQLRAEGIEP